jgi:hypothetical protein
MQWLFYHWQFDQKQGFMQDGTTLIPANKWITDFITGNGWQAANDPCSLELGSSWRIPTKIEWYNLSNAGGWTNWNGPWNSQLHLHAAGSLIPSNGAVVERGSRGRYWSIDYKPGPQGSSSGDGWLLDFSSSSCNVPTTDKWNGCSVRCVRDN